MKKILNIVSKNLDIVFLFLLCGFIFFYIIRYGQSDIKTHIDMISKINKNEISYPPNFLFYFVVNLFSGFSDLKVLNIAVTLIILIFATLAKYAISKAVLKDLTKHTFLSRNNINILALGLFFFFTIPDPYSYFVLNKMYLGKLVPLVWHNSTVIFLFPFSVLLFWKQLNVFDSTHTSSKNEILLLNILVLLNVFIKPSFIFTYIPVTFFLLFKNNKIKSLRQFFYYMSPLITGGVVILLQSYLIYILQNGSLQTEASSIVLSEPFEIYTNWIPFWFIPISFLLSLSFPLLCILLYREILKYQAFIYSFCLTIVGIIISAFIMESGPRQAHGNFLWQNVICLFLLILSTVSFLAPRFFGLKSKSWKSKLLLIIFFVHSLSGILYLIKILISKNYY